MHFWQCMLRSQIVWKKSAKTITQFCLPNKVQLGVIVLGVIYSDYYKKVSINCVYIVSIKNYFGAPGATCYDICLSFSQIWRRNSHLHIAISSVTASLCYFLLQKHAYTNCKPNTTHFYESYLINFRFQPVVSNTLFASKSFALLISKKEVIQFDIIYMQGVQYNLKLKIHKR